MEKSNEIMQLIEDRKQVPVPVGKNSNLYMDLGFDSLAFISLLIDIEQAYSISFNISEMEGCLQIGQLILLVENKLKEYGASYD